MKTSNLCKDILFGVAVGDVPGVPIECKSRETIAQGPVTDMIGDGTYHLPAGTLSDDSSLAFCLAEALTHPFSLMRIANHLAAWLSKGYWTAGGTVATVYRQHSSGTRAQTVL